MTPEVVAANSHATEAFDSEEVVSIAQVNAVIPNSEDGLKVEEVINDNSTGSWAFKCLKSALRGAKGKATGTVVYVLKKFFPNIKLIMVIGMTGSGKSSFIKSVTGEDVPVCTALRSGTVEYAMYPGIVEGREYIFLDTPGFGAADLSDVEVFHNIMDGLAALGSFVTFVGIVYVLDMKHDRWMTEHAKTLNWIELFCGALSYQNITIMTNKWDAFSADDLEDAKDRLDDWKIHMMSLLEPEGDFGGAKLYHNGIPGGGKIEPWGNPLSKKRHAAERAVEAKTFIIQRYSNTPEIKLRIKDEMDQGLLLSQTSAARVFQSPPDSGIKNPTTPEASETPQKPDSTWESWLGTGIKRWHTPLSMIFQFFWDNSRAKARAAKQTSQNKDGIFARVISWFRW